MTIIKAQFKKKKAKGKAQGQSDKSKEAKILHLYNGCSSPKSGEELPVLFTQDIIEQVQDLVRRQTQYHDLRVHLKYRIKKQAHRAVYEDLKDAEIQFFIEHPNGVYDTAPFMVLQACHQRVYDDPSRIYTEFWLKRNSNYGAYSRDVVARGPDYSRDIEGALSVSLKEVLDYVQKGCFAPKPLRHRI